MQTPTLIRAAFVLLWTFRRRLIWTGRSGALALIMTFAIGATPAGPVWQISKWANLANPELLRIDTHELPEEYVTSLAQDSDGFLWVGTQGGLARFDGYHFTSYLPNPTDPQALPDGYINTILTDSSDHVWLGTNSSGLVRFDESTKQFRTWRADPDDRTGPRSASIHALVAADAGRLWIGGDGGLDQLDSRSGVFQAVPLVPGGERQPEVRSIEIDATGTWVGTSNGLYWRKRGETRFRRYDFGMASRTGPSVWSLSQDRSGHLWVGAVNALFVLDRGRRHVAATYSSSPDDPESLAPGEQRTIIETKPGVIWAGSAEVGLSIINVAEHRVRRIASDRNDPDGLAAGQILQFFRDRSGLIWLADQAGGLLLYNAISHGIYHLSAVSPQIALSDLGAVSVAAAPRDRLWVGGSHGSLTLLDPTAARPVSLTVPNRSIVISLSVAKDGTVWIGTLRGLCRLRAGSQVPECPAGPPQVGTSRVDASLEADGTLWVGTRRGLIAMSEPTGRVTVYRHGASPNSLSTDWVTALRRDRAGQLWVGTVNGLNRLDPRSARITRFSFDPKNPNTVGPGRFTSILEDRRGRIWAGTLGGPLNVLSGFAGGSPTVQRLGLSSGLPHGNVDGLAEGADGRIWASPDRGIAVIDPRTLRARGLAPADGVPDASDWAGSVTTSASGTIFFGGGGGITVIAPTASSQWNYAPRLVITAVTLGRRSASAWEVSRDASVELPASHRDISVEFSSLDYSAPLTLRYEYKLSGYDRDWIETDARHRIATYTNLPPGHYRLHIRGMNRLGVWSNSSIVLSVVALAAWYETWWFRTLFAILLVALATVVYRARTSALRGRARDLEKIVVERTRALEEMSVTDPLTGLRNRRFLMQHIENEVALALRHKADLLFFLLDIDHFKAVNDALGHGAGDTVLAQMRSRLEQVFRASDYVLRWGGEEFLAVVRGSHRDDAPEIAERLLEAVGNRPFLLEGGMNIAKTASIGFAAFPFVPSDPRAIGWSHVVDLADQALYTAKHLGRNTWCGLAVSTHTDAAMLAEELAVSVEQAVQKCKLTVLTPRSNAAKLQLLAIEEAPNTDPV